MFEARGDPRRLLRGEKVVRRIGLDLDDPVQRVLDLVHLMGVPSSDQAVTLIEIAAAERLAAATEFDDSAGDFGRLG
ncbi:hypothetical protein MGAD_55940 [Mycolicibacterium gadium]|uniref:Uncharacterized protein n=1 Tax=Mycolicibacterium gadium TaxID=1794 RepID=A0A7I7WUD4_MYCGU|nr:hypothetical protein MGAD_55940 [Mycolicibacterium gadium]